MTAQEFLARTGWHVLLGTNPNDVLLEAMRIASFIEDAKQAADAAFEYIVKDGRLMDPPNGSYNRGLIYEAVVTAKGLEKYGTNDLADAYRIGYLMFADTSGYDVPPAPWDIASPGFLEAWETGRAANPDYKRHLAAQVFAYAATEEKFGTAEPKTAKARKYWVKKYYEANK